MTIGDDIFTILGMMPIRDRAGIQRATMADEAVKARANGNAEGQALTRQGMAPPPIQLPPQMGAPALPDDVPTEYASGRGGAGEPPVIPAPTERVVAASPAAAPSPDVRRGSDTILAEMERRKRAADMEGLFASVGLLANAFRGGGDGDSRTKLAEAAFGGGSKAPTISEMIQLQNLRTQEGQQMQKEMGRKQFIDLMQRSNGMSADQASAIWESGKSGEYLDPDKVKQREADRQTAGARARILENPKLIKELADNAGLSPEFVTEHIKSGGAFDAKSIIDLAATRGTTTKNVAEAASKRAETTEAGIAAAHREDVRANPEKYTGFYKGVTPEQLKQYAQSEKSWEEFNKGQAPSLDPLQQRYWTTYVPQEVQAGNKPKSFDVWSKEQARAGGPSPEDLSETKAVDVVIDAHKKREAETLAIKEGFERRQVLQQAWTPNIVSGGYGVDKQLMLRQTAARILGKPDEVADDSQAFHGMMNSEIANAARTLPGPLSEKELQFIKDMKGGKELSPEGIRTLHIMLDKLDLVKMEQYDKWLTQQQAHPERGKLKGLKYFTPVGVPEPSRFLKEEIEDNPEAVALLKSNPTPKMRQQFDDRFGRRMSEWVLARTE